MKIRKIGLNNYGRFDEGFDDVELSPGLNVVFGKNEAGKSTLRSAIGELIYGFQSKKSDRHPYGNGGPIELTGLFSEEDDSAIQVQRQLDAVPDGQKIIGPHVSDIGNNAVYESQRIPYVLYKGLFEMDLSDLVKLDGRKWSEVEEQIALQYGLANMLTPQRVLSDLEDEMHLLWRPHNRGKYLIKDIDEKLFELGEKKRDLVRLRKSFDERLMRKKEVESEIDAVSDHIKEKTLWINNAELQLNAYRMTDEIRGIETELASYDYKTLRSDEYKYLMRENEKLKNEKGEIQAELDQLRTSRVPLDDLEQHLMDTEGAAGRFQAVYNEYKSSYNTYCELRDEAKHSRGILENKSLELTSDPWNEALMNYWKTLSITDLDKYIRKKYLFSFKSPVLWALALTGACGIGGGYFLSEMRLILGGSAVALLSLLLMLGSISKKPLEFNDIQFREGVWNKRDLFLDACEKIKILIEGYSLKADTVESHRQTYKDAKENLEALLSELDLNTSEDLEESIKLVLDRLEGISGKENEKHAYDSKMSVLNDRNRKVGHALMMNQKNLNAYRNELAKLGASAEEGALLLERFSALEHRKEELLKKLSKFDQDHADLSEYRKYTDYDVRVTAVKEEREMLRNRREELRIELMALEKDEERVFEDQRLEAIEAEMEKLSQNRIEALDRYNHLRMTHTIISYADEAFRRKFQPSLLKRASELMKRFTGGRYDTLATGGEGELNINDTKIGRFVPVHKYLSRGTLEQVYLAMRIAVAETIEKSERRYPLILDEVFVNWDQERLENALSVLADMAGERQIIYLTCHGWMAEKLSAEYGANKIDL